MTWCAAAEVSLCTCARLAAGRASSCDAVLCLQHVTADTLQPVAPLSQLPCGTQLVHAQDDSAALQATLQAALAKQATFVLSVQKLTEISQCVCPQAATQSSSGTAAQPAPVVELAEVPSYHREADLVILSLIWNRGAPERRAHRRMCISSSPERSNSSSAAVAGAAAPVQSTQGNARDGGSGDGHAQSGRDCDDGMYEVASWVRAAVSRARKQLVLLGNADFMRSLPAMEDYSVCPWKSVLASPAVAHVDVLDT